MPAYAIFTNEQLAEMVTRRVTAPRAAGDSPALARARVDKYGAAFLGLLPRLAPAADAAGSGGHGRNET